MNWLTKISINESLVISLAGVLCKKLKEIQNSFDIALFNHGLQKWWNNNYPEYVHEVKQMILGFSNIHNLGWSNYFISELTRGVIEVDPKDFNNIIDVIKKNSFTRNAFIKNSYHSSVYHAFFSLTDAKKNSFVTFKQPNGKEMDATHFIVNGSHEFKYLPLDAIYVGVVEAPSSVNFIRDKSSNWKNVPRINGKPVEGWTET